jgi:hypothetical protein
MNYELSYDFISASQSAFLQEPPGGDENSKSYDRILSLPGGSHDLNLHLSETTSQTKDGRRRQTTKTITSPRQPESNGLPKMDPIHEHSRSEPVQPSQPMITNDQSPTGRTIPYGFRFRQISREEDVAIPQNSSFSIDYSIDEKERTMRTPNGDVRVETDIHRSQLMPSVSDIETDGSGWCVYTILMPNDIETDGSGWCVYTILMPNDIETDGSGWCFRLFSHL